MTATPTSRRLVNVVAWLVGVHVLLAYGLPEGVLIALALLLGAAYWRIGAVGAVFTSLMLVAVTLIYGLALSVTGLDERIYYRPDERYASYDYTHQHRIFRPRVDVVAATRHGDLGALAGPAVAEPRTIVFRTDRDGFRNERDYHGQRWVLLGDSFVAGTGNSQEQVLAAQLRDRYGVPAYSLAYNGGNLADYAAYLRGFRARHGEDFRVLLFLFEGNDFEESRTRKTGWLARTGRRYYRLFADVNTYRVTMTLWKRVTRTRRALDDGTGVELVTLAGRPAALYQPYVRVTERPRLDAVEGFESTLASIAPHLERIYFIPTNYRIYHRELRPGATLPNAQWDFLQAVCRRQALRCTDLTPALVSAAAAALARGELLWWRDDTHWNPAGIAVAARVVAADLGVASAARR